MRNPRRVDCPSKALSRVPPPATIHARLRGEGKPQSPYTIGNDAAARLLSIFALGGETFEQRAIFSIGEPLPSCLEFGKVK
jgi:hypothetical protein